MRSLWFILAVAVVLLWLFKPADSQERTVDAAIVFLADMSDSMGTEERRIVRESHQIAVQSEPFLSAVMAGRNKAVAVAYVEFSDDAKLVVRWAIIDGSRSAAEFAAQIGANENCDMSRCGRSTGLANVLDTAAHLLGALPYQAERMVVDLFGDGPESSAGAGESAVDLARDTLVNAGVTINALALVNDPTIPNIDQYYEDHVVGGPGWFVLPVKEIGDVPAALHQKLMREMF